MASHNGHVEVVDKLLQHGATVDQQIQVYTILRMNICLQRFHTHTHLWSMKL